MRTSALASNASLKEAARAVAAGAVIAAPTETFFALVCDPFNVSAVDGLLSLKDRSLDAGIPLVAVSSDVVGPWVHDFSDRLAHVRHVLQDQFWPGPLTLVLKITERAAQKFAPGVLAPDGTLAVRVSPSSAISTLADSLSGVVTATSANLKGLPPAKNKEEVAQYFPKMLVIEDSTRAEKRPSIQLRSSRPSTILSLAGPEIRLLRDGAIPFEEIQKALLF